MSIYQESNETELLKLGDKKICKICLKPELKIHAHTAQCGNCGVLLNFPYAQVREKDYLSREYQDINLKSLQERTLEWHIASGDRNHDNFTNMIKFCSQYLQRDRSIDVLDYGGGGGQFAAVLQSLYPKANV